MGTRKSEGPKNVIRAGFGIFYDRLNESLTLDALRQNGVRQQQFLIPNPDFYPGRSVCGKPNRRRATADDS